MAQMIVHLQKQENFSAHLCSWKDEVLASSTKNRIIFPMKRPIIAAGSLNRMLQAAEAAWKRNNFEECIETLQRAHRLAPSNTRILLQLGRVLGLHYDYAAAECNFEKALRIAPKKNEMLTAIAEQCENFRNPEIGERYLRRAVDQPDATPQACVQLAELCERLRRLPEATELVQRALKLNPAYPAALLVCARLERLAGRLEAAEQALRPLLSQPNPADWTHAQGWYELGTILDRLGKYDDAMKAFLNAKTMMLPQASGYLAELKAFRDRLKVMEANVSSKLFQRWFNNAPVPAPAQQLVLLCGHPRSGTTLLEQVLDAHPDIVTAEETLVFLEEVFNPSSGPRHQIPICCRCWKRRACRCCGNWAQIISIPWS